MQNGTGPGSGWFLCRGSSVGNTITADQTPFDSFERNSMVFDYSLYAQGDKAVKTNIAGSQWQDSQWQSTCISTGSARHDASPSKTIGARQLSGVFGPRGYGRNTLSFYVGVGFQSEQKEEKRSAFNICMRAKTFPCPSSAYGKYGWRYCAFF